MEEADINTCQNLIGYHFNDPKLLSLALTHASAAPSRLESNERMEFLGDAVLGLAVCGLLYEEHPDLLEGEMTKIKSLVVSRQICADICGSTGLCRLLLFGRGMSRGGELPMSVCAGVFEAIIGAIYVDGGYQPARQFILDNIRAQVDDALEDEHKRNFKSMLQQWAQRNQNTSPEYRFLDEKGPDHSKCFEIAVVLDGRHFASAWGTTKKEAEQEAARRALVELGLLQTEEPPAS